MSKKSGQISSNTLSLRFMQNAAKAMQEREVEAAKAKVRNEAEWEVSPEIRESWGIGDRPEDQGSVTYEQSYLPFLFPGFSSLSTIPVASTSADGEAHVDEDEDYDGDNSEYVPPRSFRGRRTFGKHGKEETAKPPTEQSQQPSVNPEAPLPRSARAISSHGRSAISSTSSGSSKSRPPPQQQQQQQQHVPIIHSRATEPSIAVSSGPAGFVKPQVDAPRGDGLGGKKRRSSDINNVRDRPKKKKKQQTGADSPNSTQLRI